MGFFLIGINLVVLICDLLEVNQAVHYASFALLGIAAAGKFVWLVVAHPKAVSGETRRKVLDWFAFGTACILFAFAVSEDSIHIRAWANNEHTLARTNRSGTWKSKAEIPVIATRRTRYRLTLRPLASIYCDALYPLKQRIGLPFALVLELHAYW